MSETASGQEYWECRDCGVRRPHEPHGPDCKHQQEVPSWNRRTTLHIGCQNCGVRQDRDAEYDPRVDCYVPTGDCPVCGSIPSKKAANRIPIVGDEDRSGGVDDGD